MRQKRKWAYLILIFVISLIVISGVFVLIRRSLSEIPSNASGETITPPPSTSEAIITPVAQPQIESALNEIKFTPLVFTEQGVAVDSSFLIQTKLSIGLDQLKKCLYIKTGESFDISDSINTSGAYELKFNELLNANRVYNIIYAPEGKHPFSYAFQTEPGFIIVSSTPGLVSEGGYENAAGVPVNTGIEINFSAAPDTNWQDYFNINPPVSGAFSVSGSSAVFIPDSLKYDTKYTVTIDSSLTDIAGTPLDRAYNIVFTTERADSRSQDICLYGDVYENFLPNEDIIIRYLLSERYKTQEFSIGVYEFNDPVVFAQYYENNKEAVSGSLKQLENITTGLFVPSDSAEAPFDGYLSLDSLPEGYYLVHVSAGDISVNKLIQINRLSVYSLSTDGDMCFWINDTSTGKAAAGASINKQNDRTVTDGDGKAMMRVRTAESSPITVQFRDVPIFVYTGLTFKRQEKSLTEKYYHYIYTDRDVYHANDTINVFGAIREINSDYRLTPQDTVTISLGDMETAAVKTDKYGCFSHTFNVTNMRGAALIHVRVNDEELMSTFVTFADYNKDKYLINAELDRHVYFTDEKPVVNINASTYDGAPAPGVELQINTSILPITPQSITTDSNGLATGSLTLSGGRSQSPYLNSAEIIMKGIEDYHQTFSAPFIVLNTDVMLEFEKLADNSFIFASSSIDRDAMEKAYTSSNGDPYSPDVYRGKPVNLEFTMIIKEAALSREKTGEYYNYILNQKIPEYSYSVSENIIETRTLSTSNGKLTVTGLPQSNNPNTSYKGEILYKDRSGREITFTIDLSGRVNIPINGYSFELIKSTGLMKLGETSSLRLNGETNEQGRVISVLTNSGILSASVDKPSNIPIVFSEDCMYSVQVFGAYFDGKHVFPVQQPLTVRFDTSELKLNVLIEPDKVQYEPGGEALLDITVTDKDGKPKQAIVNISIVDDAAFTAGAHSSLGFLDDLYSSTSKLWSDYSVYSSYAIIPLVFKESYEEMGGGYENPQNIIRKDFRDNPVFETLETDINGKAKLPIKFTDAVTRWRITSHAVSTDYCASSSQGYIVTTLPFYIDVVLTDEYIQGDQAQFSVKPQGSDYVYGESPVSYSYALKKGDETLLEQTSALTGLASFELGVLDIGDYTLDVSAKMGTFQSGGKTYTDAVEKNFRVSNTGVRLNLRASKIISSEQPQMPAIAPVESPVNFTVYNADYDFILQMLNGLMFHSPTRTDYMAASAFISDYLGNEGGNANLMRLKDQITWNSGIPEQIYGSGDPIYTARFAAAFPELMDKNLVKAYAVNNLGMYINNIPAPSTGNSTFELNRAAGYFLQAAIGGSVLNEIDAQVDLLKNANNDSNQSLIKLLYTSAYCAIGADDKAAGLYEQITENGDIQELIDALALYINTSVNPASAEEYLKSAKQNKYVSDVCERINYIRKYTPLNDMIAEASVKLDGNTETVGLKGYCVYSKSISAESYKSMLIKPVSGSISLNISYNGRVSDLNATQNIIQLDKTITPEPGNDNLFDIIFRVSLPEGSPAGYYTIRDRIPSNMRFIKTVGTDERYDVNYQEKQLVDIAFYYDGKNQPTQMRYRVIKVSPADAIIERAYISQNFIIDQPWGASKQPAA